MRTAWRALMVVSLLAGAGALLAQDRAKPRDGDKSRRDQPRTQPTPKAERGDSRRRHPQPEARPAPAPQERRREADRSRPRAEAERRHPRPDGRSPRFDPDRYWRDRQFRWDFYNRNDWHRRYPQRHYLFPYRYSPWSGAWLRFHYGRPFRYHEPYWDRREGVWFYWPFEDPPLRGCGVYVVPTRRVLFGNSYDPTWRYWGWRELYICFD